MVYCVLSFLALHLFIPKFNVIIFPFNLIGLLIAFFGFTIMGKARYLFKKHETTLKIKKSNFLIIDGVFSKSRNPMYLGMVILLFGLSIVSTNFISLVIPFVFMLLVRLIFIAREEKMMEENFGDEYLEYKAKVNRWLTLK